MQNTRYPIGLAILLILLTLGIFIWTRQINKDNIPQGFEEVTKKTGISFDDNWAKQNQNVYLNANYRSLTDEVVLDNMAGGVVAADFNNDGLIDLYFVAHDSGHLFINKGNLHFTEKKLNEAGIAPYQNGTGVIAADVFNDGHEDLLLYGYKTPVKLYRNLGNATFKDVTDQVGLQDVSCICFGAAFGDYDRDGWLDLYLVSYVDWPKVQKKQDNVHGKNLSNLFFKNNHGFFRDVTKQTGLTNKSPSLAATFWDYNNDNWPDLLVANDFGLNNLYRNNKNGTFSDVSYLLNPQEDVNHSMGIAVADFNNDGFLDAYLSDIYQDKRQASNGGNLLLTNNLGKNFNDEAYSRHVDNGGWGWGVVPIDYNNDGLVDIATVGGFSSASIKAISVTSVTEEGIASKSFLFENKGDLGFEVKPKAGLENIQNGRGLITADLDNDGYPDLIVNELRRTPKIFHNKGSKNNWLGIKLIGTKSNKDGIGAQVWVNDGSKTYFKQLQTAGSYLSSSDLRLLFGLGKKASVKQVRILWPSGKQQIIKHIKANQYLNITEPQG